ncbi:MAG: hypothetical protein MMC33_008959 [Icmadophila ericetorum]|nr:hypothetical protein [Icmadophila ericetorum]
MVQSQKIGQGSLPESRHDLQRANGVGHSQQSGLGERDLLHPYEDLAEIQAYPHHTAYSLPDSHLSSLPRIMTNSKPTSTPQSPKILSPESSSFHSEHPARHRTKLNLLNPISLLARRRSAQPASQASEYLPLSGHSPNLGVPPDDYDPRIRGKGIHDFSAPRQKPIPLNNGSSNIPGPFTKRSAGTQDQNSQRVSHSPGRVEKEHTPVFREQFEYEKEPWRFVGDERKDQQTRSIMNRMHTRDFPDHETSSLPPFARNLPGTVSSGLRGPGPAFVSVSNLPLEEVLEDAPLDTSSSNTPQKPSPPTSPPKSRSRATSITDPSCQSPGGPKRFASNASRFSFDLAGVGSAAQEKLLEDKHRQQAAQKARSTTLSGLSISGVGIRDDDDYDYDNMDDFEELEERIPGVNADMEDEASPSLDRSKHSPSLRSPVASIASTSYTSIDSPHDVLHQSATTIPNALFHGPKTSGIQDQNNEVERQKSLVRYELNDRAPHPNLRPSMATDQAPTNKMHIAYDENDFYFDDGLIDDLEEEPESTFDESIFDDESNRVYGIPIRDLPKTRKGDDLLEDGGEQSEEQEEAEPSRSLPYIKVPRTLADMLELRNTSIEKSSPLSPSYDQSAGLTQDNLTAYHDALAQATMQAAKTGKFARRISDTETEELLPTNEPQRKVTFDENRLEGASTEAPILVFDNEEFSFDDNIEDDSIIAAANAEALENDEEGFYGQEFGFYARAEKSGTAEYVNGGYFGPVGADGLRRSHSGRADFQEPSLTPITERSEWSNRNSMISYPQPLQIPTAGLSQLVDSSSSYDEDNMTLSALRKLRRGVFGGSNMSLPASNPDNNSKSGSTHPLVSSFTPGGILSSANVSGYPYPSYNLAGSNHSLMSNDNMSETASPPSSPTLTLETMGFPQASQSPQAALERPLDPPPPSSPKRRHAVRGPHSRNNSTGESVSYIKEVDDGGGPGRWIVERRRTMESGAVEILGRQVVEGGI